MVPIWMNGVMNMKLGRNLKSLMSLVIALTLAALVAAPGRALAVTELEYDPQTNPVADNVTRLDVNKLETGSRDAVVGAKMQIIDEETGAVVAEWTTDGSQHELSKILDIEKVYILREVSAPEGYEVAPDTRFILHSEEFNTTGEILNDHDNVEFSAVAGSGQEQAFVINLYDDATMVQEKENHVKREVKRTLPKTSDVFDPTMVYALGAGGAVVVIAGIIMKARSKKD